MIDRRIGLLVATLAIVASACTSGGATTAPQSEVPAASEAPAASAAASEAAPSAGGSAAATDCTVGVSWNNFQQPRWAAHDQPNMRDTVTAGGGTFIEADANLSTEQQLTDVDNLLSQGANVLVILAQDTTVIGPAVQKAKDAGVPVIAYDRLIEDPEILYVTFDNVGVGRLEAEAILAEVPTGNYVLIKGDPGDPNASTFLPAGWDEAGLKDKVDSGDIKILNGPEAGAGTWPDDYGTYTEAWDTTTATNNMESDHRRGRRRRRHDRRGAGRERQHGARRRGRPHGQELRPVPARQRPGRRPRQPEQRREGPAVRRRLEERQ